MKTKKLRTNTYKKQLILVMMAAALSLTACSRSQPVDSTSKSETVAPEAETVENEETPTEKKKEVAEGCGILRGTVTDGSDYSESISIRTDNGNDYSIFMSGVPLEEITSIKPGQKMAIAYVGELKEGSISGVRLIVTLNPQVQYEIKTVSGVTTSNAMSTFVVKGEDGEEVAFMKDNCEVEEGALRQDSGDEVKVVYVTSSDTDINYPLKVTKK